MRHFTHVFCHKGKLRSLQGQPGTESYVWVDLTLAEDQIQCFKAESKNSFQDFRVFCKATLNNSTHSSELPKGTFSGT